MLPSQRSRCSGLSPAHRARGRSDPRRKYGRDLALPPSVAAAWHVPELFAQGFGFGVVNSLHCAGMCGPLAAFFAGAPLAMAGYHAARTLAYVTIGALAGTVGLAFGAHEWGHGGAWMALVLAAFLLAFAAGLERHVLRVPGAGRVLAAVVARTRALPVAWRAAAIGAVTPFLPCGLLYAAYSAAAVAGGPLAGATSMAGFALGLLPLLAFTQANLGWLDRRLGRARLRVVSRVLMVVAAAVLAWRGVADLGARAAGLGGGCCHGAEAVGSDS